MPTAARAAVAAHAPPGGRPPERRAQGPGAAAVAAAGATTPLTSPRFQRRACRCPMKTLRAWLSRRTTPARRGATGALSAPYMRLRPVAAAAMAMARRTASSGADRAPARRPAVSCRRRGAGLPLPCFFPTGRPRAASEGQSQAATDRTCTVRWPRTARRCTRPTAALACAAPAPLAMSSSLRATWISSTGSTSARVGGGGEGETWGKEQWGMALCSRSAQTYTQPSFDRPGGSAARASAVHAAHGHPSQLARVERPLARLTSAVGPCPRGAFCREVVPVSRYSLSRSTLTLVFVSLCLSPAQFPLLGGAR